MGATITGKSRCFGLRNPLARALAFTCGVVFLGAFLFRSEAADVRTALLKTATSAKEAVTSQRPLNSYYNEGPGDDEDTTVEKWESADPEPAKTNIKNSSRTPNMECGYDMDRLRDWQKKYQLQPKFEYVKRYVQASRQNIARKSMTKLQQQFLPDFMKVVDTKKTYHADECPEPLTVPVTMSPFPKTANASDFMFGVSTTYQRFTDPRTSPVKEWTYWLTDGKGTSNGGKLILMLINASDDELEQASTQLRAAGIDADIFRSNPSMPMAVRYLTLVPTMYYHPATSTKRWLVTADDDTFFPSMHALTEQFEHYDHTQPMYIGTLSEDTQQTARHGPSAFGGAGVFLSVPMAQLVASNYDTCRSDAAVRAADSGWGPQGDILLRRCIYDHSDVRLTLLNSLWQLDLYGDPSGFYESGIKPLSLHHYRGGGWHVAHPWHYTKVASVCGEDCTLQRFQTADNFVIANGFSVAYYPRGIDFDVEQFERTFAPAPEDKGWNLDYTMGPQRPALQGTGRKISWDLQEATVQGDGSVSQVYVRKHDDWRWKNAGGSWMSDVDGVMELVWLPEEERRE